MTQAAAELAATAWAGPGAPLRQVGFGATAVFELHRGDGKPIALRIHPAGTQDATIAIQRWTESLADAGFACPWPQRTREGALVPELAGGVVSSAVQWLAGPLRPAGAEDLPAAAALLADLHLTSDAVSPADLGLPGAEPGDTGIAGGAVFAGSALLATEARRAAALLAELPAGWRGPIHGDARASRFLAAGRTLYLTGFGHGGIGLRAADLAALILSQADPSRLAACRAAVWAAYQAADGPLPPDAAGTLDAALLLGAIAQAGTASDVNDRTRFLTLAQIIASANTTGITRN